MSLVYRGRTDEGGFSGCSSYGRALASHARGTGFLVKISESKDFNDALLMIVDKSQRNRGVVSVSDCCLIISAVLERNNPGLALPVLHKMPFRSRCKHLLELHVHGFATETVGLPAQQGERVTIAPASPAKIHIS